MVIGILAIILGVIMKVVTPENPLYLRFIIFGALIYVFTRHYKWPFIVVDTDSISVLKSMWRRKYIKIYRADIQGAAIGEQAITISRHETKPLLIQRRLFKPEAWQKLKLAIDYLQKSGLK